jgi:hypothetical protein
MYKDMKLIQNVLQCVLLQFLQVSLLGTSQKRVIAKMAYLAEFWLILERDLVEHAPHKIFDELI